MDVIYRNIEEYNSNKKQETLMICLVIKNLTH